MYNAFISYSHAADGKLAPSLQVALEKFAKPWYKIRNLNIFRDETSLSATPHLWSNIVDSLDKSEYLIYLASPEAAHSKWVTKEIEYWLQHKSLDTVVIVLTDGEIKWDSTDREFIDPETNSLPKILEDKFNAEPFYIDLRAAKTQEDVSLKNPIFKKEVLKIAAHLHGKAPKNLASEEVKTHKRMLAVRNLAITVLVIFLGLSIYQKNKANEQTKIANANYIMSEALRLTNVDPNISLRLTAEALSVYSDSTLWARAHEIFRENNFHKTIAVFDSVNIYNEGTINESRHTISQFNSLAISPDSNHFLLGFMDGSVKLLDLNGREVAKYIGHSSRVDKVIFSDDGSKFVSASAEEDFIIVWDVSGKILSKINGVTLNVTRYNNLYSRVKHSNKVERLLTVEFSNNSDLLLAISNTGMVRHWNFDGKEVYKEKINMPLLVNATFLTDDGKRLIASSETGTKLWDFNRTVKDSLILKHKANAFQIFYSQDKTDMVADENGQLRLYPNILRTKRSFGPEKVLDPSFMGYFYKYAKHVAFLGSDRILAFFSEGFKIDSWDKSINDEYLPIEYRPYEANVRGLFPSPNDEFFLSTHSDGSIKYWENEHAIWESKNNAYKAGEGNYGNVSFSEDGKYLFNATKPYGNKGVIEFLLCEVKKNCITSSEFESIPAGYNLDDANLIKQKNLVIAVGNSTNRKYSDNRVRRGPKKLIYVWDKNGALISKYELTEINEKKYLDIETSIHVDQNIIAITVNNTNLLYLYDFQGNLIEELQVPFKFQKYWSGRKISFMKDKIYIVHNSDSANRTLAKNELYVLNRKDSLLYQSFKDNDKVVISKNGDFILTLTDSLRLNLYTDSGKLVKSKMLKRKFDKFSFLPDNQTFIVFEDDLSATIYDFKLKVQKHINFNKLSNYQSQSLLGKFIVSKAADKFDLYDLEGNNFYYKATNRFSNKSECMYMAITNDSKYIATLSCAEGGELVRLWKIPEPLGNQLTNNKIIPLTVSEIKKYVTDY